MTTESSGCDSNRVWLNRLIHRKRCAVHDRALGFGGATAGSSWSSRWAARDGRGSSRRRLIDRRVPAPFGVPTRAVCLALRCRCSLITVGSLSDRSSSRNSAINRALCAPGIFAHYNIAHLHPEPRAPSARDQPSTAGRRTRIQRCSRSQWRRAEPGRSASAS